MFFGALEEEGLGVRHSTAIDVFHAFRVGVVQRKLLSRGSPPHVPLSLLLPIRVSSRRFRLKLTSPKADE